MDGWINTDQQDDRTRTHNALMHHRSKTTRKIAREMKSSCHPSVGLNLRPPPRRRRLELRSPPIPSLLIGRGLGVNHVFYLIVNVTGGWGE